MSDPKVKHCDRCGTTNTPHFRAEWVGGWGAVHLADYWLCGACLAESKKKNGEYLEDEECPEREQ